MTNEQIREIEIDIQEYINKKTKETGARFNHVCIAVSRAVVVAQMAYNDIDLRLCY